MKTVSQLKALVARVGGTVEEDDAGSASDCRLFQIVAPMGKRWKGSDLHTLVCWWARGTSEQAVKFNEDSYVDVQERISHGLRDETNEEQNEK